MRLNLSKRGVGISTGVKGFHVSSGPSGSRMTGSVPGTGLYYQKSIGSKSRKSPHHQVAAQVETRPVVTHGPFYINPWRAFFGIIFALSAILSISTITSWEYLAAFLVLLVVTGLLLWPWVKFILYQILKVINRNNNAE